MSATQRLTTDAELTKFPFDRGVDALADGWRLIQASQLSTRAGDLHAAAVLEFEWVFERIVARSDRSVD